MRILHITFSKSGGAGAVALNLNSKLIARGINSEIYYSVEGGLRRNKNKILLIIYALIDEYIIKNKNFGMINLMRFKYYDKKLLKIIKKNKDSILHLHWIPGTINLNLLKQILKNNNPIVWTLHDLWPLSGGCNIEYSCLNFENNCRSCPAVRGIFKELIHKHRLMMKNIFTNYDNIKIVAPSSKMYELSIKSNLVPKNKILKIYNPTINDTIKTKEINEKSNFITIGFGAANLNDKNKNIFNLYKMLEMFIENKNINKKSIKLIIIGDNKNFIKIKKIPHKFVNDNKDKTIQKNMKNIDIWINASSQESFSLMVIEAAKNGIPLLTTNSGVVPELILQGKNGFIYNNVNEFEKYLFELYQNRKLRNDFSKKMIEITNLKFGNEMILNQYLKVYSELEKAQ